MKIGFGKLKKHAAIPVAQSGIIPLVTPLPLELQAGERVDLKTGLTVQVPKGYILSIQSSPSLLAFKGLEVLGPTFIAYEEEDELKIPLYNTSSGQINLQPGWQVAVAILICLETIEIEEFNPTIQEAQRPTRTGPRKDRFKFKVN